MVVLARMVAQSEQVLVLAYVGSPVEHELGQMGLVFLGMEAHKVDMLGLE
jgi:hypothetical protein